MRIQEIINQLVQDEIKSLAERFSLAPNQLETYLMQEHNFVKNYRTLSKRFRDIFNALYFCGFELPFSDFRKKCNGSKQDLKILKERGLIFALPSFEETQKVVIPLEYLFFNEIPAPQLFSLVQAFRIYQNTRLYRIGTYYQISPVQPFSSYAAQVYSEVIQNVNQQFQTLSPEDQEVLRYVVQYGGKVSYERFAKKHFRQISVIHTTYRPVIDDLLGVNQLGELTGLQKLFERCLLVAIENQQAPNDLTIAIPSELYNSIAGYFLQTIEPERSEMLNKLTVHDESLVLASDEMNVFSDLKKLLLLIENMRPRITSTGSPFKTDFKLLHEVFNKDKKYLLFLIQYAFWLGILQNRHGHYRIEPSIFNFNSLSVQDKYLLAYKFINEKIFPESEEIEENEKLLYQYLLSVLRKFKHETLRTEMLYEFANFQPQFRTLYEDYRPYQPHFQKKLINLLRQFFWLGLIDASPDLSFIRLSGAGQFAICGMLKRFQVTEPTEDKFIVQPTFEIIALSNLDFEILLKLSRIATIQSLDLTIKFQLNKNQITTAIHDGTTVREITEFLNRHSKNELHQTVRVFLKDLEQKEGEISLVPVSGVLEFRDIQLLEQVKILLKEYCYAVVDDNKILLKSGIDLKYVERLLKQKGLFLAPFSEPAKSITGSDERLKTLLESIQPPPFDADELPFTNPATEAEEKKKILLFAIEQQQKVKIEYMTDSYATSIRTIEPHSLSANIVEAYCHSSEMNRSFRLDLIVEVELIH